MAHAMDSPAIRQLLAGKVFGVCVASGSATTHASADTASLVTHGAKDKDGNAFPVANLRCLAIATSNEAPVYRSAAPTATQIDIRSTGTAVPYDWFLFVVES